MLDYSTLIFDHNSYQIRIVYVSNNCLALLIPWRLSEKKSDTKLTHMLRQQPVKPLHKIRRVFDFHPFHQQRLIKQDAGYVGDAPFVFGFF